MPSGHHSNASTYSGFGFRVVRTGRPKFESGGEPPLVVLRLFEFSRATGSCLFWFDEDGLDGCGRGNSSDWFDGVIEAVPSVDDGGLTRTVMGGRPSLGR